MTSEQQKKIIALREKMLTPKQIAKQLGVKVAEVNNFLKEQAELQTLEKINRGELDPIYQCLLDYSTFETLLEQPNKTESEKGLAIVLVSRKISYERFAVCTYLVDHWCLGVKDSIGVKKLNKTDYQKFVSLCYESVDNQIREISLEQAQAIVFGGVNYAESLGLKPHRDFEKTKAHLGIWNGELQLKFGLRGKPFYLGGLYDNSQKILQTLRQTVGEDNFDYLTEADTDDDLDYLSAIDLFDSALDY